MGIKLSEFVPKKQIEFSDLSNKTIAVDASNSIYQFLSSIRQPYGTPLIDSKGRITSHLQGIFSRTSNLLSQNIKLFFVFDGKPPLLKVKEQEEREQRKRLAEKEFQKAKEEKDIDLMYKFSKRTSRLTPQMVTESKELIQAFGIPIIQSPSESDAQAAFMCERKDAYAVASSDYDTLLYGSPRLVTNLTLSQRRKLPSGATIAIKPELIELKQVLESLKLNQDQLIVLGILIGTDYNIGGVPRIGPKTALKLVQQNKNFDKLFKEVKAEFNWKQIFAIFKSMPIIKNYKLKWNPIDEEKIKKILVDEHNFSLERIEKTLNNIKEAEKNKQQGLDKWFK